MVNSVNLDEVAQPPRQDLHCLQIQLFSSPVVKETGQLKTRQDGIWLLQSHLWCPNNLARLLDRLETRLE